MRYLLVLSLLALPACATADFSGPDYEELAQFVGTSLATPDGGGEVGALSDAALLARGELPQGFRYEGSSFARGLHHGVEYSYLVICQTSLGMPMKCGPTTGIAYVAAGWHGSPNMMSFVPRVDRVGLWKIEGNWLALVSGDGETSIEATIRWRGEPVDYGVAMTTTPELALYMPNGDMMWGTFASTISATRREAAREETFEVEALTTITGPSSAEVMFDGVYSYDVDLSLAPIIR